MTIKQQIYNHYLEHINDRIQNYRAMISDLAEDAQNDAKGSAGDKHETALSMMHIEQEKLTQKLKETLQYKAVLESIDSTTPHQVVALGSLVITDKFTFYISTALPKVTINNQEIIALSLQSPLGLVMKGKSKNDSFSFNGIHYIIKEIF